MTPEWACSGHVTHFKIFGAPSYLWNGWN